MSVYKTTLKYRPFFLILTFDMAKQNLSSNESQECSSSREGECEIDSPSSTEDPQSSSSHTAKSIMCRTHKQYKLLIARIQDQPYHQEEPKTKKHVQEKARGSDRLTPPPYRRLSKRNVARAMRPVNPLAAFLPYDKAMLTGYGNTQ